MLCLRRLRAPSLARSRSSVDPVSTGTCPGLLVDLWCMRAWDAARSKFTKKCGGAEASRCEQHSTLQLPRFDCL